MDNTGMLTDALLDVVLMTFDWLEYLLLLGATDAALVKTDKMGIVVGFQSYHIPVSLLCKCSYRKTIVRFVS